MTGIIDYNAGNIQSVEHALQHLGAPFILSKNPKDLENVDRIVFPGDGDALYAMQELKKTGFDTFIKDWAASGKPLVGICIGAQIVFDWSEEGNVECLSLIPGTIRHFSSVWNERKDDSGRINGVLRGCLSKSVASVAKNSSEYSEASDISIEQIDFTGHKDFALLKSELKVPHMGWNDVAFCNGGTRLCDGVADGSDFYFVHSYIIQPDDPSVIKGYADYGAMVPAIVEKDNVTVFQFHPEKSGIAGLRILQNFVAEDLPAGSGKSGGSLC